MPNFDFLNADNTGNPGPRRPVDAGPPRYPIWNWTINLDASHRLYCVVCLTNDTLFVRTEHEQAGFGCDLSRLDYEHPQAVFPQDYIRIPLASIQRIRFHPNYAWLDVVRVDGSIETIRDFETRKTQSMFVTLHERLAPRAPIEGEGVRVEREIVMAIAFFAPIALIAGLMLSTSLASDAERLQMGRTHAGVMLVESIGAPMTTLLSVAALLAGLALIAFKVFNPRKTLAVIVKRSR